MFGRRWFSTGWRLRLVLAVLRRVKPILALGTRIPGWVVVTRYEDVAAVLARNDVFSVGLYGERMRQTTGEFFLGRDETAEYERERAAAREALRPDDVGVLRDVIADLGRDLVERARPHGGIDVVADLAEIVHLHYAATWYGIPGPDRSPEDVLRLFRTGTFFIFNFWAGGRFEMEAVRAGAELRRHVHDQIAARRAPGGARPDDLLGRLLAMRQQGGAHALDDDTIVHTVLGVVSGSLEPGIGMFARAIDQILDLPPHRLGALQRAARENERAAVWRHLLEASRFNPYPPYLYRYCTQAYVMARGTRRQRTIPRGATVVPVLQSAMLDGTAVEHASAFHPGRPDRAYLNFGHGQHLCLGKRIAEVIMTETALPLLRLRNLRRAAGKAGRLGKGAAAAFPDGYYVRHLTLEFDP